MVCLFRHSHRVCVCFPWCFVVVHLTAFWDHLLTWVIYLSQMHRTMSLPKQFEYFRKKENAIEKICGSRESKILEISLMFSIFPWNRRLNVNNHCGYILSRDYIPVKIVTAQVYFSTTKCRKKNLFDKSRLPVLSQLTRKPKEKWVSKIVVFLTHALNLYFVLVYIWLNVNKSWYFYRAWNIPKHLNLHNLIGF